MINMTHRPHIHMRLRPLKLLLTHGNYLLVLATDIRRLRSGGWNRTTDYPIMSRVLCL
jgi:hypothetical protein